LEVATWPFAVLITSAENSRPIAADVKAKLNTMAIIVMMYVFIGAPLSLYDLVPQVF